MFNISDLSVITAGFISGVESQSKETLMVMLPIVGITVVLCSLALLAVVLSQLSRIEKFANFKEKAKKKAVFKKLVEAEQSVKPQDKPVNSEEINEDEMAAAIFALHLFLQETSSDPVILTEHTLENSGWISFARTRQNASFNKWLSSKKR
jgi:Na+-transporting methylmalonyl-CoA/oxaloacetate decarboxylase gamma subunit